MSNPLPSAVQYSTQTVRKAVEEQSYKQSAAIRAAILPAISRESR